MSTKTKKKVRKPAHKTLQSDSRAVEMPESGNPLVELVNVLDSVDTKSKKAKLNEKSMDDGDGGRIWYPFVMKDFKKKKEED